MLKLMYITNNTEIAKIADSVGVDRVWIDLEVNGKEERQKGLDTVKSKHQISDIGKVKKVLHNAEMLVRINPIYSNSENEIEEVINQGADIIMLPFFKTATEVKKFIRFVNKRCKTMILVETPEAVNSIDEILDIEGIDEIHIGLNDLHLGYKMNFMFELLVNGIVEQLTNKFKKKGIPYGFGGFGQIGTGDLPAEHIVAEHYRLGSTMAILSRSFCNTEKITDIKQIENIFIGGIKKLRETEENISHFTKEQYDENRKKVEEEVKTIVENIIKKENK